MHVVIGNSAEKRVTDEEIQIFLANEHDMMVSLVPEEKYLDYLAIKTPQNYYRIMASYREFSLFQYILDPIYGTKKMTDNWKNEIKFFTIRAIREALKKGLRATQKEIQFLYSMLSSTEVNSSTFIEVMRTAYYLPNEYKDRFASAARIANYTS